MIKPFTYAFIKKLYLSALIAFASVAFVFAQAPVITSFSPASGPVGTVVTINGSGFGITPATNIVFFGATMAKVTAAGPTSLTVTVPVGANYQPITVLNGSTALTGYSAKPFVTTFTPNKGAIDADDFMPPVVFKSGGSASAIAVGDLDGDGKPDLVVTNPDVGTIAVLRNISVTGSITATSFVPYVKFAADRGAGGPVIKDVDGDGKPDLLIYNIPDHTVFVYRNTSTIGSFNTNSFASAVKFVTCANPNAIAMADLDGDGKPDLVVYSFYASSTVTDTISVFRNTATKGSITTNSFAPRVDIFLGSNLGNVIIGDLDGDGKPDLAVPVYSVNKVAVFRNTSTKGSISSAGSFADPVYFASDKLPLSISIGDLDGDGKPDLVTTNSQTNTISVLRNTSTSGTITANSFAVHVDYPTGTSYASSSAIGDLDGDGKPDIAIVDEGYTGNKITVLRNTSSVGSITSTSFAPMVSFPLGVEPASVTIGDLDGDGRAELIAATADNGQGATISVLRNNPVLPPTVPAANIVFSGTTASATTASWTNGNGSARAVFISTASTGSPLPANSTAYTANPVFASGTQIGTSGWYCVYNGAGNTVNITGLSLGTNYRVMVVEYTGTPGSENYLPTTSTGNPVNVTTQTAVAINSINLVSSNPTSAGSVQFVATFASAITGLTAGNFGLITTGAVSGAAITSLSGSGISYTITVNTGTGNGTIGLNLVNQTGTSGILTALPFPGQAYTINKTTPGVNPPVISSFSPASGPVGSIVTINGTGFNAIAANNIVFFGATMAKVTAASTTSLTVTVPTGTTYEPLSVLNGSNALTGYSAKPFVATFTPNKGNITKDDFMPPVAFSEGGAVEDMAIADIDGDGKPDLVITNSYNNAVSVFRNTSTSGSISTASFAAKVDFPISTPFRLAIGDLDGDGKPDLAVTSSNQIVSVFRNVSSAGSISINSFSPKVDLMSPKGNTQGGVAIGDLDGDGKPDIVVTNPAQSGLLLYRNNSTPGSLTTSSFDRQFVLIDPSVMFGTLTVAIGDLDGDGRPEIAVTTFDSVSVFRNVSTAGSINISSFSRSVTFAVGQSPGSIVIADLDGDGKPDIITPSIVSNTLSILHNTSVAGSITVGSFAPKVDFPTGIAPYVIGVGDLDGDGKPDLAVVKSNFFLRQNLASDSISVYRNTSTIGSISSGSFAAKVDVPSGSNATGGGGLSALVVGDLDGDGKPDLAAVGSVTISSVNPLYILRNNPVFPPNIQATNVVFSATGTNTTTASWTNGNGSARAVFIKLDTIGNPLPSGSTTYTANSTYRLGKQIGTTGWYCIYNGTGSTVDISGLSSGATYRVMVTEYTGTPGGENYLTATATGNPANVTTLTGGVVAIDTISLVTAGLTNAQTVQYTATFAAAVKGLTTGNFALVTTGGVSGAAITSLSGSGTRYTVTVNAGTGDGTIGLDLANATGLTPGIITPLPFTGAVYTIDRTPPTITINTPSVSSILSGTDTVVTYAVTYADAHFATSTLAASNVTLNSTGTATGIISISGSGTADTVTVSGITGSGSLSISIAGGTASDLAGNIAPASGPSATFLVDLVLSNLVISSGTLSPVFTSTGFSYNTPVTNATATILVTPTAADPTATVTVNGNKSSMPVNLVVGFNQITITVTSPDGKATTIYTIGVTRAAPVITGLPPKIAYSNGSIVLTNAQPFSTVPTNTGGAVPATNYGQVSIFAGSPTETGGYINATGTAAEFNQPQQIVSDAAGNLYVTDAGNNAIRKISPAGVVTTFAGSLTGASGFTNGNGTAALFAYPDGLAIDGAGNLFVSDYSNNTIRKITPGGMVSTLYTSSVPFGPGGSCIDASGNVIVAAQDASQIISITPAGAATVIAGSTPGYVNGTVAAAQFSNPTDVKVDSQGNLYVVDFENNAIRKITPAGMVSTVAGSNVNGNTPGYANGVGTAAVFNNPTGLVLAPGGNIFVADYFNNDIRLIMPDGTVSLVAGSAAQVPGDGDGIGTAAGFNQPVYIYIDASGAGYVAEYAGNRIRKLTLTGYTLKGTLPQGLTFDPTIGTISGTPVIPFTAKTDTVTAFNAFGYSTTIITISYQPPSAIATLINLVPSSGTLAPAFASSTTVYTDSVPNAVSSITLTPTATDTTATITVNGIAVSTGKASGAIPLAVGPNVITTVVTAQDGTTKDTYYIRADRNTDTLVPPPAVTYQTPNVYVINTSIPPLSPVNNGGAVPGGIYGTVSTLAGSGRAESADGLGNAASFNLPSGLGIDRDGYIYVSDYGSGAIRKISPASAVTTVNNIGSPAGLTVDNQSNVYVSAFYSNSIYKLGINRTTSVFAGNGSLGNNDGLRGSFNGPSGLASDALGNIYVADQQNNSIRMVTPAGVIKTIAGNGGPGSANGLGRAATFYNPDGLTVDKLGNVFVADTKNNLIRKISTAGNVTTFAGNGTAGNADGQGTGAVFNYPTNLAFDISGNLFVADYKNNDIRKIDPAGKVTTIAGTGTAGSVNGIGTSASFNGPLSLDFDTAGNLYVTDFLNNLVRKITLTGYTIDKTLPAGFAFDPQTGVISGTPTILFPPTDYTITAYNAGGSNSTIVNISVAAIAVKPSVITFPSLGQGVNNIIIPGATSTNTETPIIYTSSNTAVAIIKANGTIELVGVGYTTITATQAGNADYSEATPVSQTINRAVSSDATLVNLAVNQGTLSPVFSSGTTSYTDGVPNSTTSITVTPTTSDNAATITVNGVPVISGTASGAIPLAVGANVITTIVTAQDGVTKDIYTVTVTRAPDMDATLVNLTVSQGTLSPVFGSGITSYTDGVPNSTTSVTITPTTSDNAATITVNGAVVTSGTASAPITLNIGPNTITTTVTAQDGVTKDTYTVVVTRAADADATLVNLSVSQGTLSPVFSSGAKSYADGVSNSTTSITVTPTTSDKAATVTVNGAAVISGTPSGAIALAIGPNTITTVITAADGTTTDTYTVIVTRAASADAALVNLTVSQGILDPSFSRGTTAYTDSVSDLTTSITVTPTTSDNTATIAVNGVAVTSGTPSDAIPLSPGLNTVTVVVTAQDGITTDTYTITVYRAESLTTLIANNVLTPNGDGKNDVWVIRDIQLYPQNNVTVYDKAGRVVYAKHGYNNDWDGTRNGAPLAEGTYYYIVDLGVNLRKFKGYIGIVRN